MGAKSQRGKGDERGGRAGDEHRDQGPNREREGVSPQVSWVDFDASNDEGWGRRGDREYRDVRPDEEENGDARHEQAGVPPLKNETEREHCEHALEEEVESQA